MAGESRLRRYPRAGAAALALVLTACREDPGETSEDALAERIFTDACAKIFACDCDDHGFVDAAECVDEHLKRLAVQREASAAAGLTIDWSCVESSLEVNRVGCASSPVPTEEAWAASQCPSCERAFGARGVGEPCELIGLGSACAQGLRCSASEAGFCYDPCAPPRVDAPCPASGCGDAMVCVDGCVPKIGRLGDLCAFFGVVCGPGLVCDHGHEESAECVEPLAPGAPCVDFPFRCPVDYGCESAATDAVCVLLPALGEPCEEILGCRAGAYCSSSTGLCRTIPGLGEPCEWLCEDLARCVDATMTCTPLPPVGSSCVDGLCVDGAICDDAEICQPGPPAICGQ